MAKKQSSERASKIAGEVLRRDRPNSISPAWWAKMKTLAASVLSQDEVAATRKTRRIIVGD